MIRYVDISEQSLQRIIPGTLNRLRQLVSLFEQYGFDIEIRDTDHTYDSLRFYPSGKNCNLNKFSELDAMLQRVIHETCCKCGTQGYVKQYPYDDKNSWGVTHCLCPDCHEHMLPKIKPIATSLKDFFGKNVTDGDIVVAITADNRPFWGLILNKPFANGWNGPNPKLGHYSLLHGWGNFPSSLGWARHFMVVANCGTQHNPIDSVTQHERKYELWLESHRNFPFDDYAQLLLNA